MLSNRKAVNSLQRLGHTSKVTGFKLTFRLGDSFNAFNLFVCYYLTSKNV